MANPYGASVAPIQWLRASDITGVPDGGAITTWPAAIGNAGTPKAAGPTYVAASGINGKPAVRFPGTNQNGVIQFASNSTANSFTVYIVQNPVSGSGKWILYGPNNLILLNNQGTDGSGGLGYIDSGTAWRNADTTDQPYPQITEWVLDAVAGTGKVYRDGALLATKAYGGGDTLGGTLQFGGNGFDLAQFDGAELLIYEGANSDADRNLIQSGLRSNYATANAGGPPPAPVAINADNAALLYSPYNWGVSGSGATAAAKTINAGAYLRTILNGSLTCAVNLNIGTATPYSQIEARIDQGPWQVYIPTAAGAQTWNLTMPTTAQTNSTRHLLEIVVKSTTETQDRWNNQTTAITFLGLTIDNGATVLPVIPRKYRVAIVGDSITEGVRVNGNAQPNDTDRNDNIGDYSYALGMLLDAEVGVIAFGGQGLTVTGSGNVPPVPTAIGYLWSGQARSFTPAPDLVIWNHGTNDSRVSASNAAVQSAQVAAINAIGFNVTRHAIVQPFNGYYGSALSAAATAFHNSGIAYYDTSGLGLDPTSGRDTSDGLHYYAEAHLGRIASGVASLVMALLHPVTSSAGAALVTGTSSLGL